MATSSSSGGKTSAQTKTDKALENEREDGVATTDQGVDYPTSQAPPAKQETPDKVTYRDPRPLDWPQKADRSVFIGVVHNVDTDPDADDPKGDYVYANQLTDDPKDEGEIELSGTKVEHAQVIAGGGRLTLVINGSAHDLTALGAGIQADLQRALQLNANS